MMKISNIHVYIIFPSPSATHDNRGSYSWPRTMAGVGVELRCVGVVPPSLGGAGAQAGAAMGVPMSRMAR